MTLRQQLLAALRHGRPVPTPDLIALVDVPHARSQVWVVLSRMRRDGEVTSHRRQAPDPTGRKRWVTFWQRRPCA